ncbi:hypothetical protein L3551_05100 [Wolbachia endosymbiont of Aedes aegypti]|nr:hypothetical protein L3551_05100 [Wolbachia endosymbiont of Aedes aegypti]
MCLVQLILVVNSVKGLLIVVLLAVKVDSTVAAVDFTVLVSVSEVTIGALVDVVATVVACGVVVVFATVVGPTVTVLV